MTPRAYDDVFGRIDAIIAGETDRIAVMATIVCELFQTFDEFHWVGFYRRVAADLLKIGAYQGGHGCLEISFDRGVCGKCARDGETQIVDDVTALPYHIACSGSTRSEIVVPMFDADNTVVAVLDIDSDRRGAFGQDDADQLATLSAYFCREPS